MKINTIMIDTDGVLRNWASSLSKLWKKEYPDMVALPFNKYELWECLGITKEKFMDFVYTQHPTELFLNSKPYIGALGFLKDIYVRGYRIILASSQPNHEIELLTLQWYLNHLFIFDEVLFVKDKCDYNVDVLIEDSFRQINFACMSRKLFGYPKVIIRVPRLYNEFTNQNLHHKYNREDFPLTAEGESTVEQYDWIIKWLDSQSTCIPEKDSKIRVITRELENVGRFSGQYRKGN